MRLFLTLFVAALTPVCAQAHVGHLSGLAGHDHWVAGAAIGAAIAIGLWAAAKGKQTGPDASDKDSDTSDDAGEEQEA